MWNLIPCVFIPHGIKVDERKLTEQIQALKKEKNDVLEKMSEIQKQVRNVNNAIKYLVIYN